MKFDNTGREELAVTNTVSTTATDVLDYNLEVARGNISGQTKINKYGRQTDIDTAEIDIWDVKGVWAAPTQARIHDITSDDANDDGDPAGTGLQTLRVHGLTGWSTAEVTEDITMNGTSNVPTVNSYVIIHRLEPLAYGSAGPNVGTITATAQTDATVTAQIQPDQGQTQMAIYGIPSTQTAYMTAWYSSGNKSGGAATGAVDMALLYNPQPDDDLSGFVVKHTQAINYTATSAFRHEFKPYKSFAGPGILKISADGSAVNNDVSAGFDLILVDN